MSPRKSFTEKDFELVFREYFPYLCAFAKKYVADPDECKDIVHNVFLNLWKKQDSIDLNIPIKSYLFKSVHNRCLNYLRDHKKIVHHDLIAKTEAIPDHVESRDYLEESELEMQIVAAIDSLPEKCRRIFQLSRFEGKKYREIAEIEGLSVKSIEEQMSKALRILRGKLSEYLIILYFFIQFIPGL
ncbi:MAG: RNA polymerase sigma-70 factor [Cyclobacteriaceae bacterium]